MEGIYSTRKEIIDVLEKPSKTMEDDKRFEGLVKKYVLLMDDSDYNIPLKTCQGVRDLFDDIVLNELENNKWPDGEIFRKDGVDVISGTQQIKHSGVNPESRIIDYMNSALSMLENVEVPLCFRIAIFHYLIGYVHPFYDGNGRLSRFISSYFSEKEFNSLVALRLSYSIKQHKQLYYKSFDICNDASTITAVKYIDLAIKNKAPITIRKDGRKNIYDIDLDELDEFLDD